jgi:hypothetical protein
LIEGEDIVEAAKGLSGTSLAEIKINRDDRSSESEAEDIELNKKKNNNNKNSKQKKTKIKTMTGISKLYCWEWPVEGSFAGFIRAKELPHVGSWKNFSPAESNASLIRPKPIVSAHTEPVSDWTMPIPTIKGML